MSRNKPLIDTESGNAYASFIAAPSYRSLTHTPYKSYRTMNDEQLFHAAIKDIILYKEILTGLEKEVPGFMPRILNIDLLLKFVLVYKKDTPYRDIRAIIVGQLEEYVNKDMLHNSGRLDFTKVSYERMKDLVKGK